MNQQHRGDVGIAEHRRAARLSNAGLQVPGPPTWMRWLPAGYVAAILMLEPLTPVQWPVSFLLIALPAIAAFTRGPVGVAAVTVFAVSFEAVLAGTPCCAGRSAHDLWERHYVASYVSTTLVGILGTALAAHRKRQEAHLLHANSVAEALMHTLLRPVPHQVGHVLAASLYHPAEAGTMVGGDLFDICATEAGERAIIGDVRGKGLQAVRTVADVLGSFRQAAYEPGDLLQVAVSMERRIAREADAVLDDELFVTAALLEYDARANHVMIINHGHIEPVLISCGEVHALTGPPALPLGLGTLSADPPAAYTHRFTRGDVLLLCTDGLVEARDHSGSFYPLIDRLRHRFAGRPAPAPIDVIDFLDVDLPRHARALHDDVAILAIAPHGRP
ncbi:PP2C family protein-serine/threonine phosphatase [Streptantibioticus ferralitis]|uniref:PP2C family protein-serine/threonine phosphatase n=1 Tax=Streptantibioticus ferralitis TaxID=236510 RepID=A0ABT5YZH0_9ACTN|nr:PP2C family protein-serine/threonine phosphatase [Streptantibioticus ferralitis]MDF2257003.1 PP2C family protein-serine/threonine phosphatase [Streptantibioticus ferralitis]